MSTSKDKSRPAVHATRESWLDNAIDTLRPTFTAQGKTLPDKIRVSVGFGYSRSENSTILGQTLSPKIVKDETYTVFVSPIVDDPAYVLGILVHELTHVAVGCQAGHGPEFKQLAEAVGLTGPMTEALPGDLLAFELFTMAAALGEYPHAAVDLTLIQRPARVPVGPDGKRAPLPERDTSGPRPQTARMIKCECECGYVIRTTRVHLAKGNASCPEGHELIPQD